MNKEPGKFINFFAGIDSFKDIPSTRMEAVLVNVPYASKYSTSADNTNKLIKQTGARLVMLDSGGFTIFNAYQKKGDLSIDGTNILIRSKRINIVISPLNIIQAALKVNPGVVIGLDYPVIKTGNPLLQREDFDKKKALNLQWMKEMSELCQIYCPHIELYLPIQCYDLDQFTYFENTLMKLKFDGLALPTRNMTPTEISKFLVRMQEMGIRKVHLLGTSSFNNIALAAYFARNYFDRCSVDSTTWSKGVQYHQYINPVNLSCIRVGRKSTCDENVKLPCRCSQCKGKSYGYILNLKDKDRREHLKRHNYLAFKKAGEDFFKHASNPHTFESHLRHRAPHRTRDIDMIMRAIQLADSRITISRDKQIWRAA